MNNELVQIGFFDLELDTPQKTWHIGLEDKLQTTLRQRAQKIKAVVAQANFIIGEELATAQKELAYKNGGFVKWLEEEIGIDFERAYEFIRIWENYKMFALSANISGIGKKVLLAGAKKDVPESARQEIVKRHEAGEKITLALSEEIIQKHKAELEEVNKKLEAKEREFALFKQEVETNEQSYTALVQSLEQKLEEKPEPQKIIEYQDTQETVNKIASLEQQIKVLAVRPNIPPETQKEIENLQLDLKNAKITLDFYTEQNRALADKNKQLSEESRRSFVENIASVGQLRIKQEWQYATTEVQASLRKFHTKVPSEIDRQSFEGEEHNRTVETIKILEQTAAMLKQTLLRSDSTVDADISTTAISQYQPAIPATIEHFASDIDTEALFAQYREYVKTFPDEKLWWRAPDCGIKDMEMDRDLHIHYTRELLKSGDPYRITAAIEGMRRTLGYGAVVG